MTKDEISLLLYQKIQGVDYKDMNLVDFWIAKQLLKGSEEARQIMAKEPTDGKSDPR